MSFCRQCNRRLLSTKVVDYTFKLFAPCYSLSSGARPVLPMGVAPEAIAQKIRV
jgi:hypothetical protein